MKKFRFDIKITLQAPLFTAAQGGRSFGLDSALLRDDKGQPAFSGALIRGNLRHAWQQLKPYGLSVDIDALLGSGDKQRSQCIFSHWFSLKQNEFSEQPNVRHRIKINDSGTVEQHMLQVIEAPFNTGEELSFYGSIWATLKKEQSADTLARTIEQGLSWVPALGAFKGIGFGKVKHVEVSPIEEPKKDTKEPFPEDIFGIRLTFDRPICFAQPKVGKSENNIFNSEEFVPGAAIIAVLAQQWPDALADQLNKLHISHALPESESHSRPVAVPFSWVEVDNIFTDVCKQSELLVRGSAPSFQPDWKYNILQQARKKCGWPSLNRLLETRTAIEEGKNSAADNKLFSIECIDHQQTSWLANINLSNVDEAKREAVKQLLIAIFSQGLAPLGKTDARADVTVEPTFSYHLPSQTVDKCIDGGKVVVSLVTNAELLWPLPLATEVRSPTDWCDKYKHFFYENSNQSLLLTHCFTRETLVGGDFLHRRFTGAQHPYKPRILTQAGSVFVLDVREKNLAKDCLLNWLRDGLPRVGHSDWQKNPYLPQNGYGEIALNIQLPREGKA